MDNIVTTWYIGVRVGDMQDKEHAIQALVAAFSDHFFKEVQDDEVVGDPGGAPVSTPDNTKVLASVVEHAMDKSIFKAIQDDMVVAMAKSLALPAALVTTQPPNPWSSDLASGSGKTCLTLEKIMESLDQIKKGVALWGIPILTAQQGGEFSDLPKPIFLHLEKSQEQIEFKFKQFQLPYIKTKAPMITFDSLTGVEEPTLPTTQAPTPDDFE